jgi:hypothetical protein
MDPPDELNYTALEEAVREVRRALNKGDDEKKHCIEIDHFSNVFVDVFIAFDDVQPVTNFHDDNKESHFVVLQRALSVLSYVPLFSFFLSTTGKVTRFGHYLVRTLLITSIMATWRHPVLIFTLALTSSPINTRLDQMSLLMMSAH